MKGKDIFTQSEIQDLRNLIKQRIYADRSRQKSIRAKMRRIGFYGQDDFGINDLQPTDFEMLLNSGRLRIVGEDQPISKKVENKTDSKRETNELSINNYEAQKIHMSMSTAA